jgi:predicted ester cyclase
VNGLGDLYRRWLLEVWAAPDARLDALAAELFTPELVIHQGGVDYPTGPAAVAELIRQARAPFRDIQLRIDVGPLVDGDHVSARWTFSGAYTGGLGVPASMGTPVSFHGIDIMRAQGDRIAEYWVSSDGLDLMSQLGA